MKPKTTQIQAAHSSEGERQKLLNFLDTHAAAMPRTALRYAIEHLDGVTPDIAVPQADALRVAYGEALKHTLAQEQPDTPAPNRTIIAESRAAQQEL